MCSRPGASGLWRLVDNRRAETRLGAPLARDAVSAVTVCHLTRMLGQVETHAGAGGNDPALSSGQSTSLRHGMCSRPGASGDSGLWRLVDNRRAESRLGAPLARDADTHSILIFYSHDIVVSDAYSSTDHFSHACWVKLASYSYSSSKTLEHLRLSRERALDSDYCIHTGWQAPQFGMQKSHCWWS